MIEKARVIKILYAEDDEDDLLLFSHALRDCKLPFPVEMVSAGSGSELLQTLHRWFKEDKEPPDLILLDINMPGMNGIQALKNIKSDLHFRSIPVVVFTTSAERKHVDVCMQIGASAFITKPASFEQLRQCIRHICSLWCICARPQWVRLPLI